MALTAAREMPARFANSAWDHSRANRRVSTALFDMILSFIAMIVSLRVIKTAVEQTFYRNWDAKPFHFPAKRSNSLQIKAFAAN
jgi:hypothetical protein